ncbi:MAG TPA: amidohydrolase family protein [Conexibacter sp.]|jgi:aminocarboxymuconate-semialdehyde decarboxylase
MPVVDAHTHFIPLEFVELLRAGGGPPGLEVLDRKGRDPLVRHPNGLAYPVLPAFSDLSEKLAQMDRDGIDVSLCSISPSLLLYDADPEQTLLAHRAINDAGAALARRAGGRVRVLATVPLNAPQAAADELRRACGELGLVGVEIGPGAGGRQLDDPAYEPFFAVAEELGTTVMVHPYRNMIEPPGPDLAGFHLANVLGNPFETTVAAFRLIVGGVLDRHPGLTFQLSHAGGAVPFQLGRLAHAYRVRQETRKHAHRDPIGYLDRFLFDSVIFNAVALRFLIERVGAHRVVFGTDLPFDMGDDEGLATLRDVAGEQFELIAGGNALRAYGIA